jgi:hypothetical protein
VPGLCASALLVLLFFVPPACGATVWNLDVHRVPTNFAPGSVGQYWIDVANVGDTPSSGPVSVQLKLPQGLVLESVHQTEASWACPAAPGASILVCTTSQPLPRHTVLRNLIVAVKVSSNASGERLLIGRLEGGGASAVATTQELTTISPVPGGPGIAPSSFAFDFLEADGTTPYLKAGGHPEQMRVRLDFNSAPGADGAAAEAVPAGDIRNFEFQLPPGFLGNPTAVGQCTPAQLTVGSCPPASQVGRVDLTTYSPLGSGFDFRSLPLFNMSSPRGAVSDIAFAILGNPVHIRLFLDPARNYSVVARASDVNQTIPIFNGSLTLWGVPFSSTHDSERCGATAIETSSECPVEGPAKAFLTMPWACAPQSTSLRSYDFWQDAGVSGPAIVYQQSDQPLDCSGGTIQPRLSVRGVSGRASSPSGLDLKIDVPQNSSPDGVATPPIESLRLELPRGMRLSAGAADGVAVCTPNEIAMGTNRVPDCPAGSRIGEATARTPLLPNPLRGSLFLAAPYDNPFASLFAAYLVLEDEEDRGISLKLPGRIDLLSEGEQIGVSFEDLPQLPLEQLGLQLPSGPRGILVTPPTCGRELVSAAFFSPASLEPVRATDAVQVDEGAEGDDCSDASPRPFQPRLTAGTTEAVAGRQAPFLFRVTRRDRDQELGGLSATLPPGVAASVGGVPRCSDDQLQSTGQQPGDGRLEIHKPACPAGSRLGTVRLAAGFGSHLVHLEGAVYLCGSFAGAPYSLVAVIPAVAGPFDLGVAVVRIGVHVDPWTQRLHLDSEPLPRRLAAMPIDLRSFSLLLDRPGFVRNPSSCDALSTVGDAVSFEGAVGRLEDRFQVGSCSELPFRPRLKLRFSGATSRNGHPTVAARIVQRPGEAALRRAAVLLPAGQLIDPARLKRVCTRQLFEAAACPQGSKRGRIRVWSPLLEGPLQGDVYLVEGRGRYPDLAVYLRGEVDIALLGRLQTPHGRVRVVFGSLPDLPLSRLELVLDGGKRGLLVNAKRLCRETPQVETTLVGHNGKKRHRRDQVITPCAGIRTY